jgi:hypothetical protein
MTATKTDLRGEVTAFFTKAVPKDWVTGDLEVTLDGEEILVVLPLAADADVKSFRETTRDKRIDIASKAESTYNRKVSWGVQAGEQHRVFTSVALPVMTRLRLAERSVLDTLVGAGVARSRADALAWCVRLVGKHEADWLKDLNDALAHVNQVKQEGPVSL